MGWKWAERGRDNRYLGLGLKLDRAEQGEVDGWKVKARSGIYLLIKRAVSVVRYKWSNFVDVDEICAAGKARCFW